MGSRKKRKRSEENVRGQDSKNPGTDADSENEQESAQDSGDVKWNRAGEQFSAKVESVQGPEFKILVDQAKVVALYRCDLHDAKSAPDLCGNITRAEVIQNGLDNYVAIFTHKTPKRSPLLFETAALDGFYTVNARGKWTKIPDGPDYSNMEPDEAAEGVHVPHARSHCFMLMESDAAPGCAAIVSFLEHGLKVSPSAAAAPAGRGKSGAKR